MVACVNIRCFWQGRCTRVYLFRLMQFTTILTALASTLPCEICFIYVFVNNLRIRFFALNSYWSSLWKIYDLNFRIVWNNLSRIPSTPAENIEEMITTFKKKKFVDSDGIRSENGQFAVGNALANCLSHFRFFLSWAARNLWSALLLLARTYVLFLCNLFLCLQTNHIAEDF